MICDVDIGNSFIKWRFAGASPIYTSSNPEDLAVACRERDVERVRVSCVAPPARCDQVVDRLSVSCGPEFAAVEQGLAGLNLAYANPASLGVDRWLAMLSAYRICPDRDFLVVSAGTAVTVDFVETSGKHIGGLIVPGSYSCAEALFTATNGVGALQVRVRDHWQPGTSTLDCVESGISALYAGFFDQVQRWAQERLSDPKIMITGGGSSTLMDFFGPHLDVACCPSLVLDGLAIALP